jgi:hypothetical protein
MVAEEAEFDTTERESLHSRVAALSIAGIGDGFRIAQGCALRILGLAVHTVTTLASRVLAEPSGCLPWTPTGRPVRNGLMGN